MAQRIIIFTALLLALAGCGSKARDQAVADQAASIFEAGMALERGANPAYVAWAMQTSGAAIIHAMGFTYPPAAELIKTMTTKKDTP